MRDPFLIGVMVFTPATGSGDHRLDEVKLPWIFDESNRPSLLG